MDLSVVVCLRAGALEAGGRRSLDRYLSDGRGGRDADSEGSISSL